MIGRDEPEGISSSAVNSGTGVGSREWTITLAAGLIAGALAWAAAETALIPEIATSSKGGHAGLSPAAIGTRNALVSFGILGGALGLLSGLAGGWIARSVSWASIAAVCGLLLGTAIGLGTAWLIVPVYYQTLRANNVGVSLMVHGATWGAIGAAAGLAFGIGLGAKARAVRVLFGGAGGALIAMVVYDLAGVILFPMAMTDRPVSTTWESRLLARVLVSLLVAAGSLVIARWPRTSPVGEPHPT
jgi:hypothetical protein